MQLCYAVLCCPCLAALRCAPLVSSLCKLTKQCVVPMSSSGKHRGNEAGKQAPSYPCSSTNVHRHGMNTLRFAERSEGPDLLGKLRRSPAQTCSRVDSLSSRTTRVSTPLYWNLDTARFDDIEDSELRSGAYPRLNARSRTARILNRKLVTLLPGFRTPYLCARPHFIWTGLSIWSQCSALTLIEICNSVQNRVL